MKKRLIPLLLVLGILSSLLVVPAHAAAEETGALQTVRALGIMVGDENGNMNLGSNVTRAQFAKMMVAASSYRDSVSEDAIGYSLFRDVKSSYWASSYIKIAVQEGWMLGYTNGTFRPNQTITLEEACATILRLLGYDASTLAGSYPTAQLNKAASLGLRDGVSAKQGQALSRRDCMYLFYNLLTAQTHDGQIYAVAQGYPVSNGQVDYASVVSDRLSGPYTATGATPTLPFSTSGITVYRDGAVAALSDIAQYDIYYYNTGLHTVWAYSDRIAGRITALSPSTVAPTSVTVNGVTYQIGTAAATYKLSALGGNAVGNTVMLLLGMDGSVADVVVGAEVDVTYYGVVKSYTKGADDDDGTLQTRVQVLCTDGATHTFTVAKSASYSIGALVSVQVTNKATTIQTLSTRSVSGTVNQDGTKLGSLTLADNVQILDVSGDLGAVKIYPSRLAGYTLPASAVRYYVQDSSGAVTHLILNDATGDAWTYGYMISASSNSENMNISSSYRFLIDGAEQNLSFNNLAYSVSIGGFALRYDEDGNIDTIRNLASVTLTSVGNQTAKSQEKQYQLSDDVQVYRRSGGSYYATTLSAVQTGNYHLTGWYDNLGCAAGGKIRVIIASE